MSLILTEHTWLSDISLLLKRSGEDTSKQYQQSLEKKRWKVY